MNARKIALIVSIGPLVGLVGTLGQIAAARALEVPVRSQAILWYLAGCCWWGVFLPLVVHWCEQDPLVPARLWKQLPRHVLRSLAATCATGICIFFTRLVSHHAFGTDEFTLRQALGALFGSWILFDLFMYGVILSAVSALAYQGQLRAKELDAAQLETALAQTEMKLLKAELDPHFIFNALHTITALVRRDPDAAERMLCRLSDFLRLTFATTGAQEVPLQQELEHLNSYMAIQMVRFRGRLFLETDVPTDLLGCRVPNLLLQPLVENIVKHAVSPSHTAVRAFIRARRMQDRLRIEIVDDGPGLQATASLREGVGLANTRGRLRKLYSDNYQMTLENRLPRGTRALVELPYRLEPIAGEADNEPVETVRHVASTHRR